MREGPFGVKSPETGAVRRTVTSSPAAEFRIKRESDRDQNIGFI